MLIERDDPALASPELFYLAQDAPVLEIRAAFHTNDTDARLYWSTREKGEFADSHSLPFTAIADGAEKRMGPLFGRILTYKGPQDHGPAPEPQPAE